MSVTKVLSAILAAGLCLSAATLAHATVNMYFTPTTGDWNEATNWIDTTGASRVPTNNDNPTIGCGDATYYYPNAVCTYSLMGGSAATVIVGDSSSGTLTITGGSMTIVNSYRAGYTRAGIPGTGTVNQQAGTIKVNGAAGALHGFGLGFNTGDLGTYNMSGGSLNTPRFWVGRGNDTTAVGGAGVFNLTGGTVSVTSYASLAHSLTSTIPNDATAGTMTVDGGTFNNSGTLYVGYAGTTSTSCLYLKSGSINMTGASYRTYVGGYLTGSTAAGAIEQTGGTYTAAGGLTVGMNGPGTYTVSGGTLSVAGTVAIGAGVGTGKFEVRDAADTINWSGASATLGPKSTLSYVAAAAGLSSIVLSNTSTGSLTIDSTTGLLSLDLTKMTSAAHDLLLIDNYGTDAIAGTFSNYAENAVVATFGNGSYYTLTYAYDAATTLGAGHDVAATNDLALVAHAATQFPGDANGDRTVNGADLNVVLSNYNQSGMTWSQGDFDGNGTVNGADLNVVLSNYNQSAPVTAAVPEPSTLLLAAAGLVGLLAYALRKQK